MSIKPFVKWVGGKRQLLHEITPLIPSKFIRYIEPFTGGGAVFFSLSEQIQKQQIKAQLNDINLELVNAYIQVRDNPNALLAELSKHIHDKDYFLAIRALDRTPKGLQNLSPVARASRFIYLNRTAFNGMYRVNAKGQFNVPFGRYKNPNFADSDTIMACSSALQNVEITSKSYADILPQTKRGDFVYLDPPYFPVSATAYFTSYNETGFDTQQQEQLAQLIRQMDKRGVGFIASNAYIEAVQHLYSGFTIREVKAGRAINANKEGRKPVSEALITNLI